MPLDTLSGPTDALFKKMDPDETLDIILDILGNDEAVMDIDSIAWQLKSGLRQLPAGNGRFTFNLGSLDEAEQEKMGKWANKM